MVSGPEHYELAEELIGHVKEDGRDLTTEGRADLIALAQVHATLALAAATALGGGNQPHDDWEAWRAAAAMTARKGNHG